MADLGRWAKDLTSGPAADRGLLANINVLTHWRVDPDLVGLRDPNTLDKMQPAERQESQKLLRELDAMIDRALAAQ